MSIIVSCTISVSEGNYDDHFCKMGSAGRLRCTISVSEGNYDSFSLLIPDGSGPVALFPFLKGITTKCLEKMGRKSRLLLHYFRF